MTIVNSLIFSVCHWYIKWLWIFRWYSCILHFDESVSQPEFSDGAFGFLMCSIVSPADRDTWTLFTILPLLFPSLVTLLYLEPQTLLIGAESGQPHLVPGFNRIAPSFSPLSIVLTMGHI